MQLEDDPGRRWDMLLLAALILCSLGFYMRTTAFSFVDYDDLRILQAHPHLYDAGSLLESLREIFFGYFPREEPLLIRDVSWAIDARLFGFENPFGYHLGNVVLNALVVGLVFLLFRRLLSSRTLAALLSLAFALLPIHVEPVSWVMGRKDLLVAFFMTLGLLLQSRELTEDRDRRNRRWLWWGGTLLCCALALGSKISAISFPLVLGLHRLFHPYLEGRRDPRMAFEWPGALRRSLPPLLPHLALAIGAFVWYRGILAEYGVIERGGPAPLSGEHLGHVFGFLPLIAAEYLRSVFIPGELSTYYRWPHVAIPLSPGERIASALWALGLLCGLVVLMRRRRDLAFFALFSLFLLAPYSGLFYVGFWRADRYLYLASAGLLAIAGLGLREAVSRAPIARAPVALLVVAFMVSSAALSWSHQAVWRNSESLWLYETRREAPSLHAFQALAKQYVRRASAASTPEAREVWTLRAEETIARGFERRGELDLIPTLYRIPEQLSISRLHELEGRIARLRQAPPLEQASHFRRAFETAPNRRAALLLSGSLYEAAAVRPLPERQPLIEASFDAFTQYLAYSSSDPRRLADAWQLLEQNYGARFPFLESRIEAARRSHRP